MYYLSQLSWPVGEHTKYAGQATIENIYDDNDLLMCMMVSDGLHKATHCLIACLNDTR